MELQYIIIPYEGNVEQGPFKIHELNIWKSSRMLWHFKN